MDYAPPEDRAGITDVQVRDNWAWTLHVAVWCHRLDMAVSDPDSSKSLVRSRHTMERLLAYFLGPRTAWKLQFEDVVAQVLRENYQQLSAKRECTTTSLCNCNQRQTTLHREINAATVAWEMATDPPSGQEIDVRLNALRTTLGTIERAITKYEDFLKDCRMQEEEAH